MPRPTKGIKSEVSKSFRDFVIYKRNQRRRYFPHPAELYRAWLEVNFDDSMNWENYGTYWQIDHIVPMCLFNLNSEKLLCFHFLNIRPVVCDNNLLKGGSPEYGIKFFTCLSKQFNHPIINDYIKRLKSKLEVLTVTNKTIEFIYKNL
jgi:hypothetical protein